MFKYSLLAFYFQVSDYLFRDECTIQRQKFYLFFIPPPSLEWWAAEVTGPGFVCRSDGLQKWLAWALFVLLLSTLVCCQSTELMGFFVS